MLPPQMVISSFYARRCRSCSRGSFDPWHRCIFGRNSSLQLRTPNICHDCLRGCVLPPPRFQLWHKIEVTRLPNPVSPYWIWRIIMPYPWCSPQRRGMLVDTPLEKSRRLYRYWLLYSFPSQGRGGRRIPCTAEVQSGSIPYHRPWENRDIWINPTRRDGVPNEHCQSRGFGCDPCLSNSMDKFRKLLLGTW